MDYEERYKQALERAEMLIEKLESTHIKGFIYHIFPELKEPEDEKIRKEIIEYIKAGTYHKNWIAWLEKQKVTDEEIIFRPIVGTDIRIAAKQALEKIDIGKKVVLAFNGAYIPVNGKTVVEIDSEYNAWLEKQGKQESYGQRKKCFDCQFNYAGECKGFCQIKKDEQIRKDILAFVRCEGQHIDKYKWHEWIVWLERQCKYQDKSALEEWENIFKQIEIIEI